MIVWAIAYPCYRPPTVDEPVSAAAESGPLPMSFTGSGGEYFRIWIVNLLLSIVTLGIYSAWAKVRRLQYFYRNTRLADAGFDYHGQPIAILKGRIVGLGLFLLYTFSGLISPFFTLGVAAMMAAIMPWLLARSLRFRMYNSSYRGLRFRFAGSTASAYWVFLALPVLTVLSFFTIGPLWHHRMKRYQYQNSSYGGVSFSFNAPLREFYVVYLAAAVMGAMALGAVIGGVAIAAVALGGPEAAGAEPSGAAAAVAGLAITAVAVVYVLGLLTVHAFVTSRIRNVVWNAIALGPHRFVSTMRARSVLWIVLTNTIATVCTLGLFWPFAQVRLAKYAAATFSMQPVGALDEFAATLTSDVDAVGEEVAELFDFDIAF
jgi:uncharacterized membrane protein YjgN (DUF898 family)